MTKTTKDYPNLYSITGDIKDFDKLLISHSELKELLNICKLYTEEQQEVVLEYKD